MGSDAPPPSLPPPTKYFWGDEPGEDEYYASQGVRNRQSYFQSPHGRLFTQSFHPIDPATGADRPVKALVFMSHGYGSDTGWLFQKIAITYANWGYAVYCADLLGHGRSDGIRCYLGDMEAVAGASLSFFVSVRRESPGLPAFLFGESMGGAATLLMYLRSDPGTWTGLIFSAPLFMVGKAIKDPDRLRVIASNPRRYTGRPRVGTMRELARLCDYFKTQFRGVTAPFLTVHGTEDGVTSPEGSKTFYEMASSADKKLIMYEGMYHSLIQGEPEENSSRVLADMRAWIDERVERYAGAARSTFVVAHSSPKVNLELTWVWWRILIIIWSPTNKSIIQMNPT
ncbi:unnamed protein product, partial [Musa acuminata var. zebrina]